MVKLKPSPKQGAIIAAAMKQGGVYMKTGSDGDNWFLPDGQSLLKKEVEWLIVHGYLKSNNDGLFPGISQTYRVDLV